MKAKLLLLTAALVGTASVSANAAIYVRASFGLCAPRVVVAVPAVRVVIPAPVVAFPVVTAPVVETVPACPGPGYVWAAGYWRPPVHVMYAHRFGEYAHHGYGRRR
ncbi:MAG: hypothetical protein ACREE6_12380 [Limisphaerales bacterium]